MLNNEYRPISPSDKSEEWKVIWDDIVSRLTGLETIDVYALSELVDAIMIVRQQRQAISQEGETYTTNSGILCINPRYKLIQAAKQSIYRLLCQFKATPAARRNYGKNSAAQETDDSEKEFFDNI